MFHWYRESDVCYVYLADYEHRAIPEEQLPKCEWLSRGWTLQELLAPYDVRFYDKTWGFIGDKSSFGNLISKITSIPERVLSGEDQLSAYSVAQRMSWAASRKTTRIEDTAYCLLGIFDINMPLLYGERHKAFYRLQKEILENVHDLTIFAWNPTGDNYEMFNGVLARSPLDFGFSSDVVTYDTGSNLCSVTSVGVHTDSTIWVQGASRHVKFYLRVGLRENSDEVIVIPLKMGGPNRFERLPGTIFGPSDIESGPVAQWQAKSDISIGVYLLTKPVEYSFPSQSCIQISPELRICSVAPYNLWNDRDHLFYYSGTSGLKAALLSGSFAGEVVDIILVIPRFGSDPKIFLPKGYAPQTLKILDFRERDRLSWKDLEVERPALKAVHDRCSFSVGGIEFIVTATSEQSSHQFHVVAVSVQEQRNEGRWASLRPHRVLDSVLRVSREVTRDL